MRRRHTQAMDHDSSSSQNNKKIRTLLDSIRVSKELEELIQIEIEPLDTTALKQDRSFSSPPLSSPQAQVQKHPRAQSFDSVSPV